MGQRTARPIQNQNPSQITVEIYEEGKENPVEVLREPAPDGFPSELLHHLGDFMARGFNAAQEPKQVSLDDFVTVERRPRDDESEREGFEGARLREKRLSFGQIALQVCRYRKKKRRHHCDKGCADRIRQNVKQYKLREEVEQMSKGELDD